MFLLSIQLYRLAVTSRLLAFAPAMLTHSTLTRASEAQKKLQDDRHTEALDLVTPLHKTIQLFTSRLKLFTINNSEFGRVYDTS